MDKPHLCRVFFWSSTWSIIGLPTEGMISWSFFGDDETLGYGSLIDEVAYSNATGQGFFFKFWWFLYYVTITDY